MEDQTINRLIRLLGSCDLDDVASIRKVFEGDNKYEYEGVKIQCEETHRTTPEYVRFTLGFPLEMLGIADCNSQLDIMTADYCLREFVKRTENIYLEKEHATGKERFTGRIYIHKPDQKIMLRNSSYITKDIVYISFVIRFPVYLMGKRNVINGALSVKIIHKEFARAIRDFLKFFNKNDYEAKAAVYGRQKEIRKFLVEKGLVSFIANGSILPRNDNGLALQNAVPFESPLEDETEIYFTDGSVMKGMGVREGVTVITGGGYSGKSTLLDGMMHGIYDHIPGDGREYCITREKSCRIIAEDGRNATSLDISPFIREVGGLNTKRFTTRHASGSTSQASNIVEAISFGCGALLIDEDRTATNFMIRDARMKKIIKDDPIVPFTDRVRQIYKDAGISTVLIIGGSSEYLDLADNVYMMNEYRIYNYNKEINRTRENSFDFFAVSDGKAVQWKLNRTAKKESMTVFQREEASHLLREFISVTDEEIYIGVNKANLSRLDTVVSKQQITAVAFIIRYLFNNHGGEKCRLLEEVENIYGRILENGFEEIYSNRFGIDFNMEMPAMHDILFAIARMDQIVYE